MSDEPLDHPRRSAPPGAPLLELVAVMDRLRSPGGCPWDAEQTHDSLLRYLVEETYEVVEAVEGGDREHLREELGDLLLQVVFHARIAAEHPTAPFDV
ncbi:MazG nucleotide pyrophosphohydrolase domain-containing protein, partial [Kineococcus glutinatus]|uniref:MazG nucleotide pyrophosphohydrolase domain-containing protein n=1 Tax=Kineococcus glutinatus TaxID=1070872 RepID=UPI0031EBAB55